MRLDRALRRARERANLTQQALADRVGVTDAYIAQLETGAKSNPSLDVLQRLARALGVKMAALLPEARKSPYRVTRSRATRPPRRRGA